MAATALPIAASLPAMAAASPGWRVVASRHYGPAAQYNGLFSVVTTGRKDAWAFGGTNLSGGSPSSVPVAEHWNGRTWRNARLPGGLTNEIIAASAPAPKDIWAVSFQGGYALHWNGAKWAVAKRWKVNQSLAQQLTGVTAFSPSNVWVFGGAGANPGLGTWHLHGRTWTKITGPGADIEQASALSASDIWAVGGNSNAPEDVVVHYSGGVWRQAASRALRGLQFADILALSRTNVWASATRFSAGHNTPFLVHMSGSRWTRVKIPWAVLPGAIASDAHGGLWMGAVQVGGSNSSWVLHLSRAGKWYRVRLSDALSPALAHIPGTSSLWAAGALPTKTGWNTAIWAHGTL